MSRKYRQEQIKISQLNAEVLEELDNVKLRRERIFSPIVWKDNVLSKFKIQDLKPPFFDEAIKLIEQNYFQNDLLCRNTNITEDDISIKSFLKRIMFNLKYKQSIVAVVPDSNEIVGILVLKAVSRNDYGVVFNRTQLIEGEAHSKIVKFLGQISRRLNIFDYYNINQFLEYFLLCVKNEQRHQGLGLELMRCGLQVARCSEIPVVSGIFAECSLQKLAESIGMNILYEMSYLDWKNEESEMIFPEPGAGNYTCALMGGKVLPSPSQPVSQELKEEVKETAKLTRTQKLQLLAKNKTLESFNPQVSLN